MQKDAGANLPASFAFNGIIAERASPSRRAFGRREFGSIDAALFQNPGQRAKAHSEQGGDAGFRRLDNFKGI